MIKFKNTSQVKIGTIFSYFLILANTLYTLFITPMILEVLGSSDYGVYKTVASLSSSLMVLDLGIGGTLMRYISKYKADKEENKIEPFISMAMFEAIVLAILAVIVSLTFYLNIENMYKMSFTASEIGLAKKLFAILSLNVVLHIFENIFNGIIAGHNNFIFANGAKIVRLILRILLMVVAFFTTSSAVVLVLIDLFLTLFLAIVEILYITIVYRLKIKISIGGCERGVFKESFIYTGLLFLTSIVGQVESNFANVIIGAYRGPELVTIYSFGLTIFQMFMQLSSSISGVMLPTVTNTLRLDDGINKAYNLAIKVGRIQFIVLGAAVVGFTVMGKQFLSLWLGEGFDDVYIIALILMIPSLAELCINICLAILRAKNMLGFKTIVTCVSAVINLFVTVIGVKYISYMFAAVGTAISYVLGYVIAMCFYYYKKFGYNMINMYLKVIKGTWICLLISGTFTFFIARYIVGGWLAFLINAMFYVVVYAAALLWFGLTRAEKQKIPMLGKFFVNSK